MSRRPLFESTDVKEEIEELKKKLAEKEGKLTAADATVSDLKKRLSDAEGKLATSDSKLFEKDSKLKSTEADLAKAMKVLEEFKALKDKNAELNARLDEASKKLAAAEEAAAKKTEAAVKAAKVTGTTPATSLGLLNGKEQNAVIEQVDIARAAAKAITGLTETAAERSEMLSRLLG